MKTLKVLFKTLAITSTTGAAIFAGVIIAYGTIDLITGGGLIVSILNIIGWNGLYNIINKYEMEELKNE